MRAAPTYAVADEDGNIPLKSREHFKFYEPLILLRALNDELKSSASYTDAAEECNVLKPEELFQAYTNKLAMVCDSTKGDYGAKVTAVWVSEDKPGQVFYHLTSNQRDPIENQEMVEFIDALLHEVGAAPSTKPPDSTTISFILSLILGFNRPRISVYLDSLRSESKRCLAQCRSPDDEEVSEYEVDIESVLGCCTFQQELKTYCLSDYLRICQGVIKKLIVISKRPSGSYIEKRGREAREAGFHDNCWAEMRHMMSRLLAYRHAVSFFFRARTLWPRLFSGFSVVALPSSKPGTRYSVRNKSLTADSIVGRFTRKQVEIDLFREFAEQLGPYHLDDRIKTEFTRDGFHPLVHGETNMLNHIDLNGGVTQERFFGGWKYIASSKPTCKLCHYYFVGHGSNVGHRSTHGNLYTNWRFPDVTTTQGKAALKKRADMLEKLLKKVRTDAIKLVTSRTSTHRNHDSATVTARMTLEDTWSVTTPADDLASILGQLDIGGGDDEGDFDDDIHGGAKL